MQSDGGGWVERDPRDGLRRRPLSRRVNSGSLTDLDPPPARERRWPFYIAWTMGGIVVGAVLP